MDKMNFDFLCNDLKFLEFGEGLQKALEAAKLDDSPAFELMFEHEIGLLFAC